MHIDESFDTVVIGGGPAGATAANDLAKAGHTVMLLDRAGRIKPCGGAIPPRLIRDFAIPDSLLVAHVTSARMVSPSAREVDMPIDDGFVGMVDRAVFDDWLRERAAANGAHRRTGSYQEITRDDDGTAVVVYEDDAGQTRHIRARMVIGADGARSKVAEKHVPGYDKTAYVFAYHEIVRKPSAEAAQASGYDDARCDVYYRGQISPDFYGWIFPHGDTVSIGTGSAHKGFSLRHAVGELRDVSGLAASEVIRREGAPIPMKPLPRWDNGRDIVLAGDAAGVVAPASGEGIYYAMVGGQLAAQAVVQALASGKARDLKLARKRFMRAHGQVFWVLGIMQRYWYGNDGRRERFVSICKDKDVQQLTWDAYMNKELVRAKPLAHARIFFKNLAHLTGLVSA